jgi:glycosyltransferase involved in cell wall biosynthesis
MKNIHLTLTPFTNETRVIKESKSLIESGLISNITILALHEPKLLLFEEIDSNIFVRRLKLKSRNLGNSLLLKIIKYIEFLFLVVKFTFNFKPKILTIHSLVLLPVAIFIKLFFRTSIVYDCHELETETFLLVGFKKKLAKILEKYLIKYVDLVVVVSDNIEIWYRNEYSLNNIITVKNSPYRKTTKKSNILRTVFNLSDDKKIIIYVGGIIRGRGIEELLECFKNLQENNLVIIFMGYGELVNNVIEYQNKYTNIFYHPAVESLKVTEYASSADFGIAYIKNGCLNDQFCLPNKLFECLFSGIPMLVSNVPDMAKLINDYSVGFVLESLTVENLLNGINVIDKIPKTDLQKKLFRLIDENCWEVQGQVFVNGYLNHLNKF